MRRKIKIGDIVRIDSHTGIILDVKENFKYNVYIIDASVGERIKTISDSDSMKVIGHSYDFDNVLSNIPHKIKALYQQHVASKLK